MKLKGDLESIGVAELFKTLAEQRATGLLSINSPMGEKTIALAAGEVAICADNLTELTRLGDLLVARGKVTDEQLGSALKAQKQDPRAKLGDVLVKQGSVTPELIAEALRFQVEEQIIDLFTWREAAFEFDSDRSVEELDGLNGGHNVQRLNVGTQALLADAAKRMENWKQIVERIPTPYLCFKIAPKGEELVGKAPRNTQAILKLLKEGRTLETTVKKSCLGRFNVYTAVIKLLDDGWIFPIPGNELRFLASEHRFKRRFLDCLYIYRRLLETAQNESDRSEFQKQIQDTIDAIHSASASGEAAEGTEIVSYKEAADRFRKRKLRRRIAFGVFIFASLFMIVFLLLKEMAPKHALPDEYQKCIKKSDEMVTAHKFDDAVKIWHDFFVSIPDKGSDLADNVRHRETAVIEAQRSYYDSLLKDANNAEKAKKFDEAEKIYNVILAEFKKPEETDPARDGLLRIKQFRENELKEKTAQLLQLRCTAALDLFKDKKYTEAREELKKLAEELPATAECRSAVDAALRDIDEIEQHAVAAATKARQELENKHGEKAIDLLELVYKDWRDVPGADEAKNQRLKLIVKRDDLKKKLAEARNMEDEFTAIEILTLALRQNAEFGEICAEVQKLLEEKKGKLADIDKMLTEAQDAVKSGDKKKARGLFAELLKNNRTYLSMKNVKIPVPVTSTPDRAAVKLDGQDVGATNCEVEFPVDRAVILHFDLDGYEQLDTKIKLSPDDLIETAQKRAGFQHTLKRSAKKKRKFAGGIFAPPVVIDGKLYVFHGDSLAILDPEGKQDEPRDVKDRLFNAEAETRPNSSGDGETIKLDKTDKEQMSWWLPRSAPEPFGPGKVLLLLRSRDVVMLDTSTLKPDTLFTLPKSEPVSRPHIELASLQGFPLVAIACAEGRIYVYNVTTRQTITKEPILADPRPEKRGVSVVALTSRNERQFISLSNTGYIRCFSTFDLKNDVWHYDLKADLGGVMNDLPAGKENLAPLVMKNGNVIVFNLETQKEAWQLVGKDGREYTHATVAPDGIYVLTRTNEIEKWEREAVIGQPKLAWGPHHADGNSNLPLVAIPQVGVFVCTDVGTISGWKAKTGEKIFDIHTNNLPAKPTVLSAGGELLYLGFPTGDLWILSTGDR